MIENKKLITATLQLFNCILIDAESKQPNKPDLDNWSFVEKGIRNGFIFEPSIEVSDELITLVSEQVSISGEKINKAFHKTWHKIATASDQQLFIEQTIHYITTYGFKALGIYDTNSIYIPNEELKIPAISKEEVKLTIIHGLTKDQLIEKIKELSHSGVALKEETLAALYIVIKELDSLILDKEIFTNEVKNRELKIMLYKLYNIAPKDPVEFLRYVVYTLTGETLIIKNQALHDKIIEESKNSSGLELDLLLDKAPSNLASIFYRYRFIFLALKKASENKTFFNKLRKDAKKKHIPLKVDYFNDITNQIANNSFELTVFRSKLESINIFRQIRLLNSLSFRLTPSENIVYRVRNGRSFVEKLDSTKIEKNQKTLVNAILTLKNHIAKQIDIKDKVFYIPKCVEYGLPATEKQFIGNFPSGTSINVEENLVAGIYWEDVDNNTVDLDLAGLSIGGKIGWDSRQRNSEVLFSGDITSAPNGASEVFNFASSLNDPYLMTVNDYSYCDSFDVPAKIFVGQDSAENVRSSGNKYLMDPNKMLASASVIIKDKQNFVGLVDGSRFYFVDGAFGNTITSGGKYSDDIREFCLAQLHSLTTLNDILAIAGAVIVTDEKELKAVKSAENIVNLAPNEIDKTSILNLLQV